MLRIPTSRIYRAFPFLDAFTDDQCELLMRRVRLSRGRSAVMGLATFVVFVLSLVAASAFVGPLFRAAHRIEMLGLVAAFWFGAPALVALVARDFLLRLALKSAISQRLEHVRCRSCGYLLLGRAPENDAVTCTECGKVWTLVELGAEAADLLSTSPNAIAATARTDRGR